MLLCSPLLHCRWTSLSGTVAEHTMRNEPHQNGFAERPWRTLSSGIVAMLKDSGLGQQWWVYCAMAFCHVHNRSANAALKGRTPWQAFYGKVPDVSRLRVFGSTAYLHVKRDKRNSLQSHTLKCVFVGYPVEYKGWLFWHYESS